MNLDFLKDLNNNIGGAFEKVDISEFAQELSNKLKNMEEKFTIDRFENDLAICENRKTGEMIEININELPSNVKEGMIIKKENNKYVEDIDESKEVSKRIKEKMDNLWK